MLQLCTVFHKIRSCWFNDESLQLSLNKQVKLTSNIFECSSPVQHVYCNSKTFNAQQYLKINHRHIFRNKQSYLFKSDHNNLRATADNHRHRNRGGALGARTPPRFCNEQRSALFISRKCPLSLKKKVPSECRAPPSLKCFLRPCR